MASPEIEDAVLDATRDCVLAYGVRRTTVSDVARRAGVSRMSIYRRWPDVRSLVIDDQTAIKVTDGTVEVVSEGHWKLFPS
jgi:AcrR family transcriptional regulator